MKLIIEGLDHQGRGISKQNEKVYFIENALPNEEVEVEIIKENPFQNPPPYEVLVGNLQGVYSRRINIQHRLVYQVYSEPVEWNRMRYDGTVKIIRMWTYYDGVR